MSEEYETLFDMQGRKHIYTGTVSEDIFEKDCVVIVDTVSGKDNGSFKQYYIALPFSTLEEIYRKHTSPDE
jgi:hypothetical protein